MSHTTTYKCDRCGHEQPTNRQMRNLELRFRCMEQPRDVTSYYQSPQRVAEWCRKCCEEFALLPSHPVKDPPAPPQPFEDLVREIVKDELASVRDQR